MIKGKCNVPGCQMDIAPGKDKHQFARNLGLHRRTVHGIHGMTANERYYVQKRGMTLEQARAKIAEKKGRSKTDQESPEVLKRRAYQAKWRKDHKRPSRSSNGAVPSSDAVPAALTQCCVCGARFYVVR